MGHVLHEADDLLTALKEAQRVAKMRVVVLELPYEIQEFGPPLEHRLKDQTIREAAAETGFQSIEAYRLNQMILYRSDILGRQVLETKSASPFSQRRALYSSLSNEV